MMVLGHFAARASLRARSCCSSCCWEDVVGGANCGQGAEGVRLLTRPLCSHLSASETEKAVRKLCAPIHIQMQR